MKKLILLLLMSSSICKAQIAEDIFDVFSDGSIDKIYSMIDDFDLSQTVKDVEYKTTFSHNFTVGTASYTLKTGILKDWGDGIFSRGFNVISLYKDGRTELILKQPEIWTYVYDGGSAIDFFIPIKLSPKSLAMVFLGWPYGGDMPYMTIVVATEKEANIVFNKRMGLDSIKTYPLYTMKVQTVLEEYDSCGKLCTPPVFTEIKASGYGTLQLKKQQQ